MSDLLRSSVPSEPNDRRRFIDEQSASRAALQQVNRLEDASVLLDQAVRALQACNIQTDPLEALLSGMAGRVGELTASRGDVAPRSRPRAQKQWEKEGPRRRYRLYIDESGGSRINLNPDRPFFAVGAILIAEDAHKETEAKWLAWKLRWIGRETARMHAVSLRSKSIGYYVRRGDPAEAFASLNQMIADLPLTFFVAAIDKEEFQRQYGRGPVDAFLPGSHYAMCLDFLLERVVHCLLNSEDAHAHVIAESRNRMDDAQLQLEYQRLQIEGTLFQTDSWFRYQLGPHITFEGKKANLPGLQLADILLRAVVEKLMDPSSSPERWDVAKSKLYDGGGRRVPGWGLKLFPGNESFAARVLE